MRTFTQAVREVGTRAQFDHRRLFPAETDTSTVVSRGIERRRADDLLSRGLAGSGALDSREDTTGAEQQSSLVLYRASLM
ncbi:hypothetical protein [Sorangium sp. So ce176]|uniref:hypothetical protein n=1 Tax=Sorangium sp. So ce176 TaxID=3133286 RepID=UPI003F60E4C7